MSSNIIFLPPQKFIFSYWTRVLPLPHPLMDMSAKNVFFLYGSPKSVKPNFICASFLFTKKRIIIKVLFYAIFYIQNECSGRKSF